MATDVRSQSIDALSEAVDTLMGSRCARPEPIHRERAGIGSDSVDGLSEAVGSLIDLSCGVGDADADLSAAVAVEMQKYTPR